MNFFNLGPVELAIIGVVALVVVGPRGLPELGRMMARWMKLVREASEEMRRGLYTEDYYRPYTPPKPTLPPPQPATEAALSDVNDSSAEEKPPESQPLSTGEKDGNGSSATPTLRTAASDARKEDPHVSQEGMD